MAVKNTIRFMVSEEKRKEYDLEFIITKVIFGIGEVNKADIYCLQDFPKIGQYDLTFAEYEACRKCVRKFSEKHEDPVRKDIKISCLFYAPIKTITVHMFNPFVDMKLVKAFLTHYCDCVKEGKRLKNDFDIYNGKIAFEVKLKSDLKGPDGLRHPPSSINIAGNRGFLTYYGQPKFCKNCFEYGHFQSECTVERRCRHCLKVGHLANNCPFPKKCDICHEEGHNAMNCPLYEEEKAKSSGGAEGSQPEGAQGKTPGETEGKPFEERAKRKKANGNIQEEGGPVTKGPKTKENEELEKEAVGKMDKDREKEEEGGRMDFQPSTVEEKGTPTHQSKKSGRKFRIIPERFFHNKCTFSKLRAMGFAKLKDSDCLVVPEGFIVPKEWDDFEKNCTETYLT